MDTASALFPGKLSQGKNLLRTRARFLSTRSQLEQKGTIDADWLVSLHQLSLFFVFFILSMKSGKRYTCTSFRFRKMPITTIKARMIAPRAAHESSGG